MSTILIWFSAISFLGYGMCCALTTHMAAEFERYDLAKFRILTGVLQLLGATGLLVGLLIPLIGLLAAGGITIQMLLGFGVRIKMKDSILLASPSLIFMVINGYLFFTFYQNLS